MPRLTLRILALTLATTPLTASAADFWWRGDINTTWNSVVPIFGNVVTTNFATTSAGDLDTFSLPDTPDIVRFATSVAPSVDTSLGRNFSIAGLTTEPSLSADATISNNTLTLGAGGIVASAPRQLTIHSGLTTTQAALTVNAAHPSGLVTLTSGLTGPAGLTKSGQGTLHLSGTSASTFTGTTTVNAGTLIVGPLTTLGPGGLTLNTSGAVESRVIFNNPAQTIGSLSTGSLGSGAAVVELANSSALTVNLPTAGTFLTYLGTLTGNGSFTKSGPGNLDLGLPNTHTGGTTITEGTLFALVSNALPANTPLTIGRPSTASSAIAHLNGTQQTLSGLTLFARPSASPIAISASAATLIINGNVSLLDTQDAPGNQFGARIFQASAGAIIDLGGAARTFNIAGQNRSQDELVIDPIITNGGIILNATPSSATGAPAGMVLNAPTANTYTGGTTVNAGTLTVNASTRLGLGDLTLNTNGNVASRVILNNATQTIRNLATGSIGTTVPVITLNATALTVSPTANSTYAGTMNGTGSLIKSGSTTLTLANANTYSGGTFINTGTLAAAAASAIPTNTPLTIGVPQVSNRASLSTGGFAQTVSGISIYARASSSPSAIDIGSGLLTLNGDLSLLNLSVSTGNAFGAVIAAAPGGTLGLGAATRTFNIAGQNISRDELTINAVIADGGIILNATPSVASLTGAGMVLGASSPNTYTGGTTINSGTLTVAASTTLGTGPLILNNSPLIGDADSKVILNNPAQSITSLQTGNPSDQPRASILLNGTALTIHQSANTTFTGAIAGTGSLTQAGTGTLTLTGALSYTGNTLVTGGGKLVLNSALNTATGDVLLSSNGKIDFARARTTSPIVVSTIDNLTLPSGSIAQVTRSTRTGGLQQGVLIVNTLTITGTGFLDLTNNDLIVRTQSVASVRALVSTWLTANNGLPGTIGLGSSESFYTADGAFTTLAVYDNSLAGQTLTTFEGIPVIATDVLVKYTYLGDTNIDGVVDASDLSRLLQGLNGQGTGWNFGDINYDGVVNFTDLGRLQAALRGQGAPLSGNGSGGGSPIPEPSSLALLSLPALALLRLPRATTRRRRR